jgi:hypothetical protein
VGEAAGRKVSRIGRRVWCGGTRPAWRRRGCDGCGRKTVGERAGNGPKRLSGLGLHDGSVFRKRKEMESENRTGLQGLTGQKEFGSAREK